jgi:hypothetical protein
MARRWVKRINQEAEHGRWNRGHYFRDADAVSYQTGTARHVPGPRVIPSARGGVLMAINDANTLGWAKSLAYR